MADSLTLATACWPSSSFGAPSEWQTETPGTTRKPGVWKNLQSVPRLTMADSDLTSCRPGACTSLTASTLISTVPAWLVQDVESMCWRTTASLNEGLWRLSTRYQAPSSRQGSLAHHRPHRLPQLQQGPDDG